MHCLVSSAILFGVLCTTVQAQPHPRPNDGLLDIPVLQRIVTAQTARAGHALIPLLNHPDAPVRARAAFALASVQDTTAIPVLRNRLTDTDPSVRADAAFALGQIPYPDGHPGTRTTAQALYNAWYQTTDPRVRRRLLEALGKVGDFPALADLLLLPLPEALTADWAMAVARFGLRDLHHAQAIDRLVTYLTHPDPQTREYAAYYFGRVSKTEPWQRVASEVRTALDGYPRNDPAAIHLLPGLGRLEDPADTPRMRQWLATATDWRIRTRAAGALASRTADAEAQPALLAALTDAIHHVAQSAASALGRADSLSEPTLTALETQITQQPNEWHLNTRLLPILARHDRPEMVFEWLDRDPTPTDPFAAAAGLGALADVPGPEGFTRLLEATEDERALVAYTAVRALRTRWQEERLNRSDVQVYYEAFVRTLRRNDVALGYVAAQALTDSLFLPLGAATELREAYPKMQTPAYVEAMVETLRGLGQLGDTASIPLLREAAQHPEPLIHRAAADALQVLTGETLAPPTTEPTAPFIDWAALKAWGPHPTLVLDTKHGPITIEMDVEAAPLTAQTLLRLAEAGNFDGVPFHRVVPNFVVQGGDYSRRDGFGGPPFVIRSEFTQIPYQRGTVGMASLGKDTEGSQFFIAHSIQPHLDGRYTAFGTVVSGMEAVDKIGRGDRILKAFVE